VTIVGSIGAFVIIFADYTHSTPSDVTCTDEASIDVIAGSINIAVVITSDALVDVVAGDAVAAVSTVAGTCEAAISVGAD